MFCKKLRKSEITRKRLKIQFSPWNFRPPGGDSNFGFYIRIGSPNLTKNDRKFQTWPKYHRLWTFEVKHLKGPPAKKVAIGHLEFRKASSNTSKWTSLCTIFCICQFHPHPVSNSDMFIRFQVNFLISPFRSFYITFGPFTTATLQ